MTQVPSNELNRLLSLDGYDQMLEIDRVCRQYGIDEQSLRNLMASFSQPIHDNPSADTYDATLMHTNQEQRQQKTVFGQSPDITHTIDEPTYVNKDQFHFDYDPSVEAKQRRSMVEQAIVCPACGVALGIPSQRPIKVTCPQCLHEATFTN